MLYVTKADGRRVPFDESKIEATCIGLEVMQDWQKILRNTYPENRTTAYAPRKSIEWYCLRSRESTPE
jgi:hypothetical protein